MTRTTIYETAKRSIEHDLAEAQSELESVGEIMNASENDGEREELNAECDNWMMVIEKLEDQLGKLEADYEGTGERYT